MQAPPQRGDFARFSVVVRYASYFGEPELALAGYRRIAAQMIGGFIINFWSPLQAEMRKLPGFKELVREVGLATYWRKTGEWGEYVRPVGADDFECR